MHIDRLCHSETLTETTPRRNAWREADWTVLALFAIAFGLGWLTWWIYP